VDVRRTHQFLAEGSEHYELARLCRSNDLHRVRHGAFAQQAPAGAADAHHQLIKGTWPLLADNAVLSHGTAALLHGLPLWEGMLATVSVTRDVGGHGRRTRWLRVHHSPLGSVERVTIGDYRVTSIERTAIDVARTLSFDRAVAILDAALRLGADQSLLDEIVAAAAGRKGARVAREALAFADGRSESVGESISRARILQVGLPAPELQVEVFTPFGLWVARGDFGWREERVIGEFDGKVKYLGTPEEVADAVMREKAREQAIRDAGWWVVRWTWKDLGNPRSFRQRIEAAFRAAASLP
jgi:hypothetical protein